MQNVQRTIKNTAKNGKSLKSRESGKQEQVIPEYFPYLLFSTTPKMEESFLTEKNRSFTHTVLYIFISSNQIDDSN